MKCFGLGLLATSCAVLSGLALFGCSGKEKVNDRPRNVVRIKKLVPYTMKVRRPPGEGADPKVGPGGEDYSSKPLPDARFDCQSPAWLFSEMPLDKIRSCLAGIKEPIELHYRLERYASPFLKLAIKDPEATPACLIEVLGKIPVPREIVFQSNEEGRLECYSSRLNVAANQKSGVRLPTHRLDVVVNLPLPLESMPADDHKTMMLLLSWALSPYWDKDPPSLEAHLMPEAICNVCLGEKEKLKQSDPVQELWP